MDNIPDTVNRILEVLAEKFGSTGKELWTAILKQQYIDATASLVFVVLLILFDILIMLPWGVWLSQPCTTGICDGSGWFGFGIVALLNLYLPFGSYTALTGFLNPTYSALSDILSKLGKD